MKMLKIFATACMSVALCLSFNACSDDDNGKGDGNDGIVNPSNVFTGGVPKSVSGISISTNSDGFITAMTDDGKRVSFEYHNVTRSTSIENYVKMTVVDEDNETYIFNLEIGDNGFVKRCGQLEPDGDRETWAFGYNTDGNLNYMERSEGGNEVTTITYANGNITKTSMVSEEEPGEKNEYTIEYTSEDITTPIENKGCLMLFDTTLGIDMDEMKYAYYAGLLGKATKNLPLRLIDDEGDYTFTWTLNENGYPTKMIEWDGHSNYEYSFAW